MACFNDDINVNYINSIKAEKNNIQGYINQLDKKMTNLANEIADFEVKIEDKIADIEDTKIELEAAKAACDEQYDSCRWQSGVCYGGYAHRCGDEYCTGSVIYLPAEVGH